VERPRLDIHGSSITTQSEKCCSSIKSSFGLLSLSLYVVFARVLFYNSSVLSLSLSTMMMLTRARTTAFLKEKKASKLSNEKEESLCSLLFTPLLLL